MEEELQEYCMEWGLVENGTCRADGKSYMETGVCCMMQGLSLGADRGLQMSYRGPWLFCMVQMVMQLILHFDCVIAHKTRNQMKNEDEDGSGHRVDDPVGSADSVG